MFEAIVANFLNRILGRYVANLEQNQLKLSIFSGNVELRGLKLRKEALEKLRLPIEVFEGYLGELSLQIPWAALKTKPIVINISDLFILAGPKAERPYDEESEQEQAYRAKMEKLETAEIFRQQSGRADDDASRETFVNQLLTKIVDNFQIVIKRIHIRYEDRFSHRGRPFAVGLMLYELSAVSTNSDWVETFVGDAVDRIYKLARLTSLSLYWIPATQSFAGLLFADFCEKFRAYVDDPPADVHYLIKPVAGTGRVVHHKRHTEDQTKTNVSLQFDAIDLQLDQSQYYDALKFVQYIVCARRALLHRSIRPRVPLEGHPLEWLRYAASCFLERIRERNRAREWPSVLALRQDRHDYIAVFKKKETRVATEQDLERLEALERRLSYDHLKWFRALARREVRIEALERRRQASPEPQAQTGWFGWLFSSGRQSSDTDDDILIEEKDVKAFYEAIDYDESMPAPSDLDLPPSTKLFQLSFELGSGSFSLAKEYRQNVLQLQFVGLCVGILRRPKTVRVDVELADLFLLQSLVSRSHMPTLVKPKEGDGHDGLLFKLTWDQLPTNLDAEYELRLQMKPLEVVLDMQAFEGLTEYFVGGRNKQAVDSFVSATESRFHELASKTRIGLEQAISRHKSVDLFVDIEAPIVLVPLDCTDRRSLIFVLDLGRVSIRSQLVTKQQREELKTRLSEDISRISAMYYDRMEVVLNHAKLNWSPTLEEFQGGRSDPVIEPIDLYLTIAQSLVRRPGLAPLKIKGNIPSVVIRFTDERYRGLLGVIDVLFPDKPADTVDRQSLLRLPFEHITSVISLDDVLPVLSKVAVDAETGETFYDTHEDVRPSQTTDEDADRVNFEFGLFVEQTKMVVESEGYGGPVGTIMARQLHVYIFDHPFDMLVRVSLNSFSITDQLNGASSVFATGEGIASQANSSLLNVVVRLVQPAHPLFAQVYQSCRYHVSLEMSSLSLSLDGQSLFTLVRFVRETFASGEKPAAPPALRRSESLIGMLFEDGGDSVKHTTPVIVKLALYQLIVSIGRDAEHVANLIFKRAGATILYRPDELLPEEGPAHQIEMHGQLMDVLLMELGGQEIPFLQIEGKHRMDFWYTGGRVFEGGDFEYGHSIRLLAGSPRLNYRPSLLWSLLTWWNAFKAHMPLMDVAAPELLEEQPPSRLHFDVSFSSPVIDVRPFGRGAERLSIYLGQIVALNTLGRVDDTTGTIHPWAGATPDQVYDISLDAISTSVTFADGVERHILGDTSVRFRVVQVFDAVRRSYANAEAIGCVDNDATVRLTVTQEEYTLLLDRILFLSMTIGEAVRPLSQPEGQPVLPVDFQPDELSVELFFSIPAVLFELVDRDATFTEIRLDRLATHVTIKPDGELIADIAIGSLSMRDARPETALRFVDFIVPTTVASSRGLTDSPASLLRPPPKFPPFTAQLNVHYERNGVGSLCDVNLDSPRAVMVLNYLFAVKSFMLDGYPTQADYPREAQELLALVSTPQIVGEPMFFQAAIKDLTAFILENPSNEATEAFHVTIPSIVFLSKAACTNLDIHDVQAAFCNMDAVDTTRIDCLAPISFNMTVDGNRTIMGITPIAMSFSYQDMEMLRSLYTQFMSMQGAKRPVEPPSDQAASASTSSSTFSVESVQITFIDDFSDIHLPFLELTLSNVALESTSNLVSGYESKGIIHLAANFFNLKNSHWEPLVEPWSLHMEGSTGIEGHSSTVISSSRPLELVVSHAFMEALLQISSAMTLRASREPSATRAVALPYLIVNLTGYEISLWSDGREDADVVKLAHGASTAWTFQDWRQMRRIAGRQAESTNRLSVHLVGSHWESVRKISVDRPGLTTYPLRPRLDDVSHKLACSVQLESSNIKRIVLRSTCLFSNRTSFTLEILDVQGEADLSLHGASRSATPQPLVTHTIDADAVGALSITHSFRGIFRVRPHGLGYAWSDEFVRVDHLAKHAIVDPDDPDRAGRGIICRCQSTTAGVAPFYFLLMCKPEAPYQPDYPVATIYIRTLLAIWNLLPYDIRFQIYDRTAKFELNGSLSAGRSAALQFANFDHDVGMRIEIPDADLRSRTITVINNREFEFDDDVVHLIDSARREAQIFIDCRVFPGGTRRVFLYSPYVLLNHTGLQLELKSGIMGSNEALGAGLEAQADPAAVLAGTAKAKPLLLCPGKNPHLFGPSRHGRIRLRTPTTHWSKVVSLDAVSTVVHVDLFEEVSRQHINLALYVRLGNERFSLTKIVTVHPHHMLANRTGHRLWVVGREGPAAVEVAAGSDIPLHMHPDGAQTVQVAILSAKWTVPSVLEVGGKTHVKLHVDEQTIVLLRIEVKQQEAVTWVVVNEEQVWPVRLRNRSSYELLYYQKGCSEEYSIPAGHEGQYAWDRPATHERRLVLSCHSRHRELNLHQIGRYRPLGFCILDGSKRAIAIDVHIEGPVVIVDVSNFERRTGSQQSRALQFRERERNREAMLASELADEDLSADEEQREEDAVVIEKKVLTSFAFRLPGIGISLVNRKPEEILYCFARDFEARYSVTEQHYTYGMSIHWLQLDNQLFDWQHPIVVYPALVRKSSAEEHPFCRIALIQSRDSAHGLLHFIYAGALLQEVNVEMGEDVVRKILDFTRFEGVPQPSLPLLGENELVRAEFRRSAEESRLLYFENFQIHPIRINLTFTRTESRPSESQSTVYNPLAAIINVLTMAMGNITDAPLRFNALLLEHPIVHQRTLFAVIYDHYSTGAIGQLHRIVGSADFIGNPVGLFNSFSSGVHDLFYEPYQGFVSDRPQDFGIGLARGGLSLVRKTVYGLTDTFSKVTGSMGKGLSAATFDPEFQTKRRLTQARNRPRHALYGIKLGAQQLFEGITSGITGIVEKPIEGAQREGVEGFFKGVGKGLLGVLVKPITGVFDFATNTIEGVRNSADEDDRDITQIRAPRVIPYDGILTLYSERDAEGQLLLSQVLGAALFYEYYVAHLEVREMDPPSVLFLTTNRILLARIRGLRISWQVPFDELVFSRPDPPAGAIQMATRSVEPRLRSIPVRDANVQRWWCHKVAQAVSVYSETRRPVD